MSCGRPPRSAAGRVCYNAARDVFFRIFLKTGVGGQKPDAWDRGPGGAVQPSKKPVLGTGAASQGGNNGTEAGATVTATVTATPADPLAPSDGASNAGPVEGEPVAGAAFQLDQPYTLSDSSVLKISSPVKQKHSYAGTEYYKFTVSYTNNSPKEFQPMSLVVQATTGTQTAESTIDSANKCDVTSTDVLPGKTLEWMKCFQAEPAKPFNLQWSILLSSDKGNVDVTLPS